MEWLPGINAVVWILLLSNDWARWKVESGHGHDKMYGILFQEYELRHSQWILFIIFINLQVKEIFWCTAVGKYLDWMHFPEVCTVSNLKMWGKSSWQPPDKVFNIILTSLISIHMSTLAWKVPWTEEPGRLQSMGSLRVRHDWVTSLSLSTFIRWGRKWQPTPVFLPGESQGRGSLVGCCLCGRTELYTTEAT